MRAIRELACSEEFRLGNFTESKYLNQQNHKMPSRYLKKNNDCRAGSYRIKGRCCFDQRYIFGNQIRKSESEKVIAIDKVGNMYYNVGVNDTVSIGSLDLTKCIVLHNHPKSNGIVSLSSVPSRQKSVNMKFNNFRSEYPLQSCVSAYPARFPCSFR